VTTTGDQTYNDFLTFSDDLTLQDANIVLAGGVGFDIGGSDAANYEQISAFGALSVGGILDLTLTGGFDPAVGDTFDLLFGNTITDLGLTLSAPALSGGRFFGYSIVDGVNTDLLRVTVGAPGAPVPKPATLLLMSIGLAILGLLRGALRRSNPTGNSLA